MPYIFRILNYYLFLRLWPHLKHTSVPVVLIVCFLLFELIASCVECQTPLMLLKASAPNSSATLFFSLFQCQRGWNLQYILVDCGDT